MKRIIYEICGNLYHPNRQVSGYVVEINRTDGEGVVTFAVRKAAGGSYWVTDHVLTGTSVSVFRGRTRNEAIATIRENFQHYEDRILRAQSSSEHINSLPKEA